MNYGIESFLIAKNVSRKTAVRAFLDSEKINKKVDIDKYIQDNWERFASFIDTSIKSGKLKGTPIKLNTYFDEQRERNEAIKKEFEKTVLSKDELFILNIPSTEFGKVHSFINKKGLSIPKQDDSYTSKKLRKMPIILLLRDNNMTTDLIDFLKPNLCPKKPTVTNQV